MPEDPIVEPTNDALALRYGPVLEAEQAALSGRSDKTAPDRKPVELDQQSVGRLSRMDAIQAQAMARAMQARRSGRGRAVAAALRRLDEGAFGFCEDCGDFIGWPRLDLDPCVPRCRDCAPSR